MSAGEQIARVSLAFTRPSIGEREVDAVAAALRAGQLGGNGAICRRVEQQLARLTGAPAVLLTSSATSAMEIGLQVIGLGPGDEVLMPSFAFPSQAGAVLALGARPVFCDVHPDTLNLDPDDAERRVTERTKTILPVHYAGIACDMDALGRLAAERGLSIFEDAAQAVGSRWDGRHLGTLGVAGALSFHATKNLGCGEGGALLLSSTELASRAEIALEKGTNRSAFLRGEVERYTWVGRGGSHVLSDLLAALLEVQLARLPEITAHRRTLWDVYHEGLADLEDAGRLRRPVVPARAEHNAHIYLVQVETPQLRDRLLGELREAGIGATFHYQPLHSSPFAREVLGLDVALPVTERAAEVILRLPLHGSMDAADAQRVVGELRRRLG